MNNVQISLTAIILMVFTNLTEALEDRDVLKNNLKQIFSNFGLNFTKTTFEAVGKIDIASPISDALLFSTLLMGASNRSREELRSGLHVSEMNDIDVKNGIASIIDELKHFPGFQEYSLVLGMQKRVAPTPYLTSLIESKDLNIKIAECEDAKEIEVCRPLQPNEIKINVVYKFQAHPSMPVIKYIRKASAFRSSSSRLTGAMIYLNNTCRHGESASFDAKWIEIPLEHNNPNNFISMIIVVPNKKDGLNRIVSQMNDTKYLFTNHGKVSRIKLWMPEFRFKGRYINSYSLKQMGFVGYLYNGLADLQKFFNYESTKEPVQYQSTYHNLDLTFEARDGGKNKATTDEFVLPSGKNYHDLSNTGESDVFVVDGPFIGFIISENIIHFSFIVEQ